MKLLVLFTACISLQGLLTKGQDVHLLTSEGEEGWLENLLEQSNDAAKREIKHIKLKRIEVQNLEEVPTPLINNFMKGLDSQLPKEKASVVKNSVTKMTENWKSKPYTERNAMVGLLKSAAGNIVTFTNTKDDPVKSIQSVMEVVSSFAMVCGGPYGQAFGAGLSFVSAFLSMFGGGKDQPESMDSIVKRQIKEALDAFYEQKLSDEAKGTEEAFQVSKAFLDGISAKATTLSDTEANALASHIPVYSGITFMGILASQIEKIKADNPFYGNKGRKCIRYIELYIQLATLKNQILVQMAGLLPDSHSNIRNGLMNAMKSLQNSQNSLIKFLYESDYKNYILPFFIPTIHTSTDKYALETLMIPNYDRTLSGTWCLKLSGYSKRYFDWHREYKELLVNGQPYTLFTSSTSCYWMLVPHGKNLFSIVNNYGCPRYELCYQQLSWKTISSGVRRVYLSSEQAIMWEIEKSGSYYRIRSKWGCNFEDSRCKMELGQQTEYERVIGTTMVGSKLYGEVQTGGLMTGVGYKWQIQKY